MGKQLRAAGQDGRGGEEEALVEEISVKMDPRVLDCNICFEAPKPPIFQCEVGHILCSPCHEKLRDRCLLCCKTTGHSRCFAIEQFIDAVKVPCSNARYGCGEFIPHHRREEHETRSCAHAPCFCPEDGCPFRGPAAYLVDHLAAKHGRTPTNFHCGRPLWVSVPRRRRFALLVGEDDLSMFLLSNTVIAGVGNALAVVCVRPRGSGDQPRRYSCKISAAHRAAGGKGRLVSQTDPNVASSSLLGGVQLGEFFLLVPPELADKLTDQLAINIRIDQLALR